MEEHPQLIEVNKLAKVKPNWGIIVNPNGELIIHTKTRKGHYWRSKPIANVIHAKAPFIFVKTISGLYKLEGNCDQNLCKPKQWKELISLAFMEGFPAYWSTLKDVLNNKINLNRLCDKENNRWKAYHDSD